MPEPTTRIAEAALPFNTSHDSLRSQLHSAIKTAHGLDGSQWSPDSPWVSSVFPAHVVYHYKGETLKRPYTATHGAAGTNPTIKLGDSKPVHVAYMDSKAAESQALLFGEATLERFLFGVDSNEDSVIITPGSKPDMVRESAAFDETVKVTESAMTKMPVKIIGPGWGSMAYYSKEVLKRDGPKVYTKGTHMMWNHATDTEESERPEGDLNHLAAVLTKDAEWRDNGPKGPGLYSEAKVFSDYASKIQEKGAHIGVSINAGIRGHEGSMEGRSGKIADALVRAYSVDFVTRAGAGGAPIVPVTESQRAHTEGAGIMDEKAQEALTKENVDLKERVRVLESSQHEVVAFSTVAAVLREAEIPFRDTLLKRACANPIIKEGKIDADWVKSVVADFTDGHDGKVTGMGDGQGRSKEADKTTEAVEKRLKEALGDLGVPKAGLDYAVAGRA